MHRAPGGGLDTIAAAGGYGDPVRPPRRVYGLSAAREQPQSDLRAGRVQRLAEELALAIGHRDDAWRLVGLFGDVAAVDPRMALLPAFRTARGDFDRHRSGRNFAA